MTERVFIVGAPRSGAGLLHTIWQLDPRWAPSALSGRQVIDEVPGLSVAERGFTSHRLTDADLDDAVRAALDTAVADAGEQTVDWNARASLRIPLLAAAFPDAKFVLVVRDVRHAVASGMEAWRSGRFVTVLDLPDWWGEKWSYPLVGGWRERIGAPLAEVVAAQTVGIASTAIADLQALPTQRWAVTSYEALLDQPEIELERIAGHLGVAWDAEIPDDIPLSPYVISRPDAAKWQRQAGEVLPALAEHDAAITALREFRTAHVGHVPEAEPVAQQLAGPSLTTRASKGTPFSSAHSTSVVELLSKVRASLLVTTYKSGHVIIARSDGAVLDTTFKHFNRPMGVAVAGSRLAIGTADAIVSFSNQPALAARIDAPTVVADGDAAAAATTPRAHDAVYAPRSVTFTGDVAMHEMAYGANGELWFVNTRFSCLSRQDLHHSFVPTWRPPWISALAAEDRCHLNGMAMVDGRPRYLSALSQTDTPNGWREHKGTSGLVIDITNNAIVAEGLAMPHSPRWHDGRLWILESGKGTLSTIDLTTGTTTLVATLPGFTRGLAFIGRYALIGLSQVRESVFKDLPVTKTAAERNAGVWIVDTQTGAIVGLLKFDGVVQEIFDVQVLPGATWPIIIDTGEIMQNAFVLPTDALADVAQPQ